MTVTTEWMERQFDALNQQCFLGTLPKPAFALSRAKTRLGQCRYTRERRWRWKGTPRESCVISLTTYYDMETRDACNVLLHEMIHYYIAHNHLKDSSPHGPLFRRIAQSLNQRWGWQVSVRTNVEGWRLTHPERVGKGPYLVLAVETKGGERFLTVVAPAYARKLEAQIRKTREVRTHQWYTSRDEYFSGFPKVRSLRGRKVSEETMLRITSACQPLSL